MKIEIKYLDCGVFGAIIDCDAPRILDVYRNKTTLEITYKDSIPIDSTVVFKE